MFEILLLEQALNLRLLLFFFFLYKKNSSGHYDLNGNLSNSIRDFLPFGNLAPTASTTDQNQNGQVNTQTNNATTSTFGVIIPVLRQISTAPVAGETFVYSTSTVIQDQTKKTITNQSIRFVDRATGHIFETNKDSLDVAELSNTTIPKVYGAYFSSNPANAIFRFLNESTDTIVTEYAKINAVSTSTNATSTSATSTASTTITAPTLYTGTPYITKTSILPSNLEGIALSPTSQRLLYLFSNTDGGTFVFSNLDGSKPTKLYSSPLSGWLLDWPNEKDVVINTKPSGIANGIALLVNTTNGSLTKVASGNGLTTLVSPDLSQSLVGTSGDGSTIQLSSITLKDSSTINLSLKTLPEKCVWAHTEKSTVYCAVPQNIPNGTYPDSWYQGLVSFTDDLWKINTSTGVSKIVSLWGRGFGKNFDAVNLQLSSDDSYLTFMNKDDLILWGYRLKNPVTASSTATSTQATTTVTK